MHKFTVVYLGKYQFELRIDDVVLAQNTCHTLKELENWAGGYCSSWNCFNLKYDIAQFKKEMSYVE